jgi:hydroxymethylpyrimidine pyrophosphatase-like HAD family hydrolase
MKFGVLALDYDGTIAQGGVLDPEVRSAIAEVRTHGIAVVIVTGRILAELEQVAGDLHFVDAVVGENGAVMWFANGYTRQLAHSASIQFLQELGRRGLEFKAGQCVVELDAAAAPQVLAIIRELELPLVLVFNRSSLMVLPQSVGKGAGLREALATLRLSVHNAIGIGDAENDHDLLAACEIGVAVSWGSRRLQEAADEVLQGNGPTAVAAYIRRAARDLRLPPEKIRQHRLSLGICDDGRKLTLAIRGLNTLIAGDPRSGKSWTTGLICEQLILQGYSVCVIDPEGDYRTLETLPGVVVFGGEDPPPELPDVARVLRHPDMSVVIDLSHAAYQEKMNYMKSLLPMLAAIRRNTGMPHRIVMDEAHYFLHEPIVGELLDLTLGAYTLVTYRLADLHPNLRNAMECIIVKRTTEPRESQTLMNMLQAWDGCSTVMANLASLGIDEAVLLPGIQETGGQCLKFKSRSRLTSHVRHKAKYLDVQLLVDQGFWFADGGETVAGPARTLKDFLARLELVPPAVLAGHARQGDFSRWIADVFHDHALASEIRKVEQRFRLGHIHDLTGSIAKLVQERYAFSPGRESEPQATFPSQELEPRRDLVAHTGLD